MASLCISPVQAGIRPLRTANSSFILDLRRRSIRLWAVFRAIFLPAALVAEGCFFLEAPAPPAPLPAAPDPAPPLFFVTLDVAAAVAFWVAGDGSEASSCTRGFIWMILRDRVGGGGRANDSFCCCWAAAEERLRDLTVSLGCVGYAALGGDDVLGEVLSSELEDLAAAASATADGGSSKAICRVDNCFVLSWTLISVEESGVGGMFGRGISDKGVVDDTRC